MEIQIRDLVNVTRCFKCPHWHNFAVRPNGNASPLDMGLCNFYRVVKDATGYCDRGSKEVKGE